MMNEGLSSPATKGSTTTSISVTLKWSKQVFQLDIHPTDYSAISFKEHVQNVTGVPVARQKLLAKKGWKGTLRDDFDLSSTMKNQSSSSSSSLTVTLIGSAERLAEPSPSKQQFIEDLSPEELRAAERAQEEAAMATAKGMIVAIQKSPHLRDDKKTEMYSYNRLVTGLPQRQIEDLLVDQSQAKDEAPTAFSGRVVMTLGMELRRAYINDLSVLVDGTLVSALDDGHVQLWRHGALEHDVIHGGVVDAGGADSVVAFSQKEQRRISFATAGRGCTRLWTSDAEELVAFPSPLPGTSPTSLVVVPLLGNTCLAARFRITRPFNPHQFRLAPQDDEGRRRRAQAEAQEMAIEEALARISRSVQVWFTTTAGTAGGESDASSLQSQLLEPQDNSGSTPVTSLATLHDQEAFSSSLLVAGDSSGGLRLWQAQEQEHDHGIRFQQKSLFQLIPTSSQSCSVVCMEPTNEGRLAVSTEAVAARRGSSSGAVIAVRLSGATEIAIPLPRAVYILGLQQQQQQIDATIHYTLDGHKDSVQCMCQLPNGHFLTGGGKLDATLQVWTTMSDNRNGNDNGNGDNNDSSAMETQGEEQRSSRIQTKSNKTLDEVGYIFSLALLPDDYHDKNKQPEDHHLHGASDDNSPASTTTPKKDYELLFAVAAARYNVVKIFL